MCTAINHSREEHRLRFPPQKFDLLLHILCMWRYIHIMYKYLYICTYIRTYVCSVEHAYVHTYVPGLVYNLFTMEVHIMYIYVYSRLFSAYWLVVLSLALHIRMSCTQTTPDCNYLRQQIYFMLTRCKLYVTYVSNMHTYIHTHTVQTYVICMCMHN